MIQTAMTYWCNLSDFRFTEQRFKKYASRGNGFILFSGRGTIRKVNPFSMSLGEYGAGHTLFHLEFKYTNMSPSLMMDLEALISVMICINSSISWFCWSVAQDYDDGYYRPSKPHFMKMPRDVESEEESE